MRKCFFLFQASYIVKEVRCIHLTNLHSLHSEQVARSSTPSTKQIANLISKLNFYKLIPYPMDNC